MSGQESFVIQKITVKGQEMDLSLLRECTYAETCDLSSPFLSVCFYDPYSAMRNNFELKEGDEVGVTMENIFGIPLEDSERRKKTSLKDQNGTAGSGKITRLSELGGIEGESQDIEFTIMSLKISGDSITLFCIEKNIIRLKTPAGKKEGAVKPMFFKNIKEMCLHIFPNFNEKALGQFPETDPFHLKAGIRPSDILRKAAREKGSVCFVLRGVPIFNKLENLKPDQQREQNEKYGTVYPPPSGREIAMLTQYLHGKVASHNPVIWYKNPQAEQKVKDRIVKNYATFDFIKGRLKSSENSSEPVHLVGCTDEQALNDLSAYSLPIIDFQTYGSTTAFVPGFYNLNLFWFVHDQDKPLDESLPQRCRIWGVYHHYRPSKYFCRVVGVRVPGTEE